MKIPSLTEIAKSTASFVKYEDGELHYRLSWSDPRTSSSSGPPLPPHEMVFRIPLADAGAGAFLPTMRGVEILRWARKHADMLRDAQENT